MKGWTQEDIDAHQRKYGRYRGPKSAQETPRPPDAQEQGPKADSKVRARKKPNKCEFETRALLQMIGGNYSYEPHSFDVCGGAKYTPDWIDEKAKIAVEAKSEFIHSRDSRRRFDEAKFLYPQWTWIWVRKRTKGRKGPRWEIEVY